MHCTHEHGFEKHPHHGHSGSCQHHSGCCCTGGGTSRHFFTKEEMITHLEKYLEQLQSEAKGVEEHINNLKSVK